MAKQASLAAQGGALTKEFKLPEVFGAPDPIKPRFIAPYITFAHNKRTDEFARIIKANGGAIPNEHSMWLIRTDRVDELKVAKLGLFHYQQLWVTTDTVGGITGTAFKEMPHPWKEYVEAVGLLYFGPSIVPVNIQFRTTKCPAIVTLAKALSDCQQPGWAELSSAHKDTLAIPTPNFRFFGDVTIAEPRTSRSSGNMYRSTKCTIHPTTSEEWTALKAFTEDPDVQKVMADAGRRYSDQLAFYRSKEAK